MRALWSTKMRSLLAILALGVGLLANPSCDQLAPLGQDANLAVILVDVDASLVHKGPFSVGC